MKAYLLNTWRRLRFTRPFMIPPDTRLVSFTFDDVPESGFTHGGSILKKYGLKGTFYTCLSLLESPYVEGYKLEALLGARKDGHELACHTYSHIRLSDSSVKKINYELDRNSQEMQRHFPDHTFRHFSYPFGSMDRRSKNIIGWRFTTGRSITPGINKGLADMAALKAIQLYEQHYSLDQIFSHIEDAESSGGWLIFYTHDVQDNYSPYGCSPAFLEAVVQRCVQSKLSIASIDEACRRLTEK